jgi:hypothetical protein
MWYCEIGARVVWVTLRSSPRQALVSSDVEYMYARSAGEAMQAGWQGLEAAEQARTHVHFREIR